MNTINTESWIWAGVLAILVIIAGTTLSYPTIAWVLLALIAVSFIAIPVRGLDLIVPVAVLFTTAIFGVIDFYDPTMIAVFFIGLAFLGIGLLMRLDNHNWGSIPMVANSIGGIVVIPLLVWLGLVQFNVVDESLLHDEANVANQPTEQSEAVTEDVVESPAIKNTTINVEIAGSAANSRENEGPPTVSNSSAENLEEDGEWIFWWSNSRDTSSYYVETQKFSELHINTKAYWTSAGEDGFTQLDLSRKSLHDSFEGKITVTEAGNIPYSDGIITLEKRSDDCLVGQFNTHGTTAYAKLLQQGSECEI